VHAWPRLAERDPPDQAIRLGLRPKDLIIDLKDALELLLDAALEDIGDPVQTFAAAEGSAIAAAAAVAAVSLQKRPDAEALVLWLADAVLARHLKWPAPLIAGQIRRRGGHLFRYERIATSSRPPTRSLPTQNRFRFGPRRFLARAVAACTRHLGLRHPPDKHRRLVDLAPYCPSISSEIVWPRIANNV
jgi:Protein of unknown function (DUF1403)